MKTLVLRHEYRRKSAGSPNLLSCWSICETDGRILLSTRSLRTFRAALNKLAGSVQHVPNDDQTGFQWSINWLIQQPQAPEPAPAPQQAQAKHTPGPWKVSEYEKQSETDCGEIELTVCTNYPEALCNGQRSIAVMTGGYYTRKDQKNRSEAIATNRANARLIAAAPQLLEALRNLVETPEVRIEDIEQARAAIAAATGE